MFGGVKYAMSGPSKPAAATATPPINASSSDEADFIKCANSMGVLGRSSANRETGSSSTSRTRSTKRLNRKRGICGISDAVYVYELWEIGLSIDSGSRIQYHCSPRVQFAGSKCSFSTLPNTVKHSIPWNSYGYVMFRPRRTVRNPFATIRLLQAQYPLPR